jgi:3-oxoacyl-[acyl-carrier protein] reductase
MSQPLSTKIALVTGGARGIGAAIVRRLAADGAAVAFTLFKFRAQGEGDRRRTGGRWRQGAGDPGRQCRFEGRAGCSRVDSRAFWRSRHFVNNAGILILNPLDDYSLEDFDRMFAVNVRAAFVGIQAAARHMKEGGRIITIGSVAADRSGFPTSAVYSMTKGAIAAMTRGLARDLGSRGITVNNIQPGPTATDMNSNEDDHERLKPLMALGRLGEDREIAGLAAYLASAEAAFVTGASLTIDGGSRLNAEPAGLK